ncbi:hypothetical protein ACFV2X_48015 [Streptomyces sp. NPDC059679]|uniref:hypothetical protein n=1 Tax=Streptomyces sp. NPDC059679 TaxID=3346903 RepID=UPI0036C55D26
MSSVIGPGSPQTVEELHAAARKDRQQAQGAGAARTQNGQARTSGNTAGGTPRGNGRRS